MSEPLVSVVMASYNSAPFVAEAVGSVLTQTYRNLELIVVDDSSSDATPDIVERLAKGAGERIQLIRNQVNEGPCRARNQALAVAQGSLICWIDHDDVWLPTKVAEQVEIMERRPDVGLLYAYFDAFDSSTGDVIHWPDGRRDFEGDVLVPLFSLGCFIGSVTTMFRREALDRRGGRLRETDFSFGDDYYLWMTIALDWTVLRIPQVLARYRRHGSNESSRLSTGNAELQRVKLLEEFLAEFPEAIPRLGRSRRSALARYLRLAARQERANRRLVAAAWLRARGVATDALGRIGR